MISNWVREVEHATFTPLVLSATGGMGRNATFYKWLASMVAMLWVLNQIQCQISFEILYNVHHGSNDLRDTIQPRALSVQSTFNLWKATLIDTQLPTCPVLFFFFYYLSYRSSFLPNMYNVFSFSLKKISLEWNISGVHKRPSKSTGVDVASRPDIISTLEIILINYKNCMHHQNAVHSCWSNQFSTQF